MHSPKELQFNDKIDARLVDHPGPLEAYHLLRDDPEIAALQDYSNVVSIKRLGYNDHGPVHDDHDDLPDHDGHHGRDYLS